MEKELNIAEILKDKPKGLKLWSDTFGVVELICITESNFPINLRALNHCAVDLTKEGHYYNDVDDTLPCIVPSKSMRDWSKFAWKKGDVLVNDREHIIFDKWENSEYTIFKGVFDSIDNKNSIYFTNAWEKEIDEQRINKYISQIEKDEGGELDLETLEIKKPQFKDGDIVVADYVEGVVFICICNKVEDNFMYCHARMNSHNKDLYLKKAFLKVNLVNRNPRPATDSEKQQLFSALEKNGKAWDTEKKQIVDLPKKCEFKAFDKVLARDTNDEKWLPKFFSDYDERGIDSYPYGVINSGGESVYYKQCIPYNDQTAHLLGTTDGYAEGGEE